MRVSLCAVASSLLASIATTQGPADAPPRGNWDFKLKDFVIGAWWGPGATEAEVRLYKECGFNVVMSGRYMEMDDYGNPIKAREELDLCHKYGLGVMFDTYTMNDQPWGGIRGKVDPHPLHHPASIEELRWLHSKFGDHPALVGFMIGDDQGAVSSRAAACTQFLHEQGPPHLFPWLCGWISPDNLAANNNPIEDPQIYPTLYNWGQSAEEHARGYAATYASFSRQCRDKGALFWPMFNASSGEPNPARHSDMTYLPSDSLLRFPAYAAVAYGAQGIWYFCYGGGSLEWTGTYTAEAEARAALTPMYAVAKKINHRIAAWGPMVMGRTSTGLFGTAFGAKDPSWPFAIPEEETARSAEALAEPGPGKLVEEMDDDLIAGVLTSPGESPLVVVVNCRTSKGYAGEPPRTVTLRFCPRVMGVEAPDGRWSRGAVGRRVTLELEGGGGQVLVLRGAHLDSFCTEEAVYAPVEVAGAAAAKRPVTDAELAGITAAKLRIDVFGSNGGEYAEKYMDLNGTRIAQVPVTGSDSWRLKAIDLSPGQLPLVRRADKVIVRTEGAGDAWKFRNIALAVRLADGSWIESSTDGSVHSVADWAHSEGSLWGADGVAGPIEVGFE